MPDLKNVLVTGGAGFIGSNFVRFLLDAEEVLRIVTLDALTYSGSLENLKGLPRPNAHIFVQGDICDAALVERLIHDYEIDTIVHFAAETHVDRSILDPGLFIQTNVVGTYTLLEAARKYWINDSKFDSEKYRFHHVSTDEVFGSLAPNEPAWNEGIPYAPNSPYAASKAASDHLVRAYGHTYGLPYTITNCSNNYGPFQFPEKLIPLMVLRAIDGKPLPIYGDGKQIRDWLYVEDHCEAIWQVLLNGRVGESYNVGGNCQPANLEIVDTLCDILDEIKPDSIFKPHAGLKKHVADRPGHDRRYALDIGKIRSELGWEPKHDLHEGLLKTVRWYLAHGDWIDRISKKDDYQAWLNKNYTEREEGGK